MDATVSDPRLSAADGVAGEAADGVACGAGGRRGGAVAGLLLAAGAGRRMGRPKGLLRDADGTAWVTRAARALADGGCRPVVVVVGAEAGPVAALVPDGARVVVAEDWAEGMGASLRTGLAALAASVAPAALAAPAAERAESAERDGGPDAALVGLVDTPGVTAAVVARMVAAGGPRVLARAGYDGRPGHPVLIGSDHWVGVAAAARGDAGARAYLAGRDDVLTVECSDLGHGRDLDTPEDLAGGETSGSARP